MRHRKHAGRKRTASTPTRSSRLVTIDKYDLESSGDITVRGWAVDLASFTALRLTLPHARDVSHIHLWHAQLSGDMVRSLATCLAAPDCSVRSLALEYNPLRRPAVGAAVEQEASTAQGSAAGEAKEGCSEGSREEGGAVSGAEEGEGAPPSPPPETCDVAPFLTLLWPQVPLEALSLRGCGLQGREAGEGLGAALLTNTTLQTLVVSDNPLGGEGLTAMAHGVRDTPAPLAELDVGQCGGDAEGVLNIARAAGPAALSEAEYASRSALLERAAEVAEEAATAAAEAAGGSGKKKGGSKKDKGGSAAAAAPLTPWFLPDLKLQAPAQRAAVDLMVVALAETGDMPSLPQDALPPRMLEAVGAKPKGKGGGGGGKKGAQAPAITDDTPGIALWLSRGCTSLTALCIAGNPVGLQGLQAVAGTLAPPQLASLVAARPAPPPTPAAEEEDGGESKSGASPRPASRSSRRSASPRSPSRSRRSSRGGAGGGASARSSEPGDTEGPAPLVQRRVTGVHTLLAQDALGVDDHLYSVYVPRGCEGGYVPPSAHDAWAAGLPLVSMAPPDEAGGVLEGKHADVDDHHRLRTHAAQATPDVQAALEAARSAAQALGVEVHFS